MTNDNNSYFHLTNLFLEKEGLVLEGNRIDPASYLDGAAFMSADQAATGTHWKLVPIDNEHFHLTNRFLEDQGLVLEGNRIDPASYLKGAAFMSADSAASGTHWKMEAVSDGYFHLTNRFLQDQGLVLEGNKVDPASYLDGKAFMSSDSAASGTQWKLVPIA